jgi:hypothetical protein
MTEQNSDVKSKIKLLYALELDVTNRMKLLTLRESKINIIETVSKCVDHVQGQGVPRIESGAYTPVREHFNLRENAAIGRDMHFLRQFLRRLM